VKARPLKAAMQLHEFLADAHSTDEARTILQAEGVDLRSFGRRLNAARTGTAPVAGTAKSKLGEAAAQTQEKIRSFMKKFGAENPLGQSAGAFARSKGSGRRDPGSHANKQDSDANAE